MAGCIRQVAALLKTSIFLYRLGCFLASCIYLSSDGKLDIDNALIDKRSASLLSGPSSLHSLRLCNNNFEAHVPHLNTCLSSLILDYYSSWSPVIPRFISEVLKHHNTSLLVLW